MAGSRRLALCEGEYVIGRDPASARWLDVAGVSRHQARMVVVGEGAERTGHMAMSREEQIDALHRAALQRDKRERPALLPGGRVGPGIAGVRSNHCSHSRVGCAAIDWSLARRTSSRAE
jgi:hypothetical protein